MKYVVTGSRGFLGTHVRYRLALDPVAQVTCVHHDDDQAIWEQAVAGADAVIHCAGVNRAAPEVLVEANIDVAARLIAALDSASAGATAGGGAAAGGAARPVIVYASSTYADQDHPGSSTAYAQGKRRAGEILREWGERRSARVLEIRFPGLFGEHGRPDYNSFVATFAHRVATGQPLTIADDRELPLLYVQDAVSLLLSACRRSSSESSTDRTAPAEPILRPAAPTYAISAIARRLRDYVAAYSEGQIPNLPSAFDVRLFNTLRAAMWPQSYPFRPTLHTDPRGSLCETIRVHGGVGQTFASITNPGHVRGNHVHFEKIERFHVVSGQAVIRLRRMLTQEVLEFAVDGTHPQILDMPTFWVHSIENVGTDPLVTVFWSNALLDDAHPDTYPLPVSPRELPVDLS